MIGESLGRTARSAHRRRRRTAFASGILLCTLFGTVDHAGNSRAATAGWDWYAIDPHVHSVLSGDAAQDLGVMARRAREIGLDAVFVTDHTATSTHEIGGVVSSHIDLDESLAQYRINQVGDVTSSTAAMVAAPVASGSSSLALAVDAATAGESFASTKRGPNLRSGRITLHVQVFPTQVSAASGIYVSVSLGGDPSVPNRPVNGFTTAAGEVRPGQSVVFVWQIGGARVPSADPRARVVVEDLPYSLGQWNVYDVDVTQAIESALAPEDRPRSDNGLQHVKITAGTRDGSVASGFVDDFHLDAASPPSPGEEFVARNADISAFDTPTFQLFASQEVGYNRHVNWFDFGITDPAQFQVFRRGTEAVSHIQSQGFPAMLNHPGLPGGAAGVDVIANHNYGADLMEVVPRGPDRTMLDVWDRLLNQGDLVVGTWSSDAHRTESLGEATFVLAPSRGRDDLLRSLFEGRGFMAEASFAGHLVFNADGSDDPHPSRYPVAVGATTLASRVHLSVDTGLSPGDQLVWIKDGAIGGAVPITGSEITSEFTVAMTTDRHWVRAEIRRADGSVRVMSEPIMFVRQAALPAGISVSTFAVDTASGRGYTGSNVRGITAVGYDEPAQAAILTTANPVGSSIELRAHAGAYDVTAVTVDGGAIAQVSSFAEFETAAGAAFLFESVTRSLRVKYTQLGATTGVSIALEPSPDQVPPEPPARFEAVAENARVASLAWTPAFDDVGVTQYVVSRDGGVVAVLGPSVRSYIDESVRQGETHRYELRAKDAVGNTSEPRATDVTVPELRLTTLNATADTYVSASAPTSNFGASTVLRVDGSPILNGLVRFEVPTLPGVVLGARLELFANSNGTGGFRTRAVNGPWSEGTVTGANQPVLGAVQGISGSVVAGTRGSATVIGVSSGLGRFDIGFDTVTSTAVSFSSREGIQTPRLIIETSATAPSALPVLVVTAEDEPVTWLPAATDADGDSLQCSIATSPLSGVASVEADCSSGSFTPAENFHGVVTFDYSVTDGTTSRRATVGVDVTPVNDPPSFDEHAGVAEVVEDVPQSLVLPAFDPDGDCPLELSVVVAPLKGTLGDFSDLGCAGGSINPTVMYTPTANAVGSDEFVARVTDPSGEYFEMTFSLHIEAVNDAPTAGPIEINADPSGPRSWVPVVGDVDGDALLCTIETPPSHGSAVVAPDCSSGSYLFTSNSVQSDQFSYAVSDGVESTIATVRVGVGALIVDGFESGSLADWAVVNGLVVQSQVAVEGQYAAEGGQSGVTAWARRQLPGGETRVTMSVQLRVASLVSGSPVVLRLRDASDRAVVSLQIRSATGQLRVRNEIQGRTYTSATVVTRDAWTTVSMQVVIAGAASGVVVTLDGVVVADLSRTFDLGTAPIWRVQIGNNGTGEYHWYIDDVRVLRA